MYELAKGFVETLILYAKKQETRNEVPKNQVTTVLTSINYVGTQLIAPSNASISALC